MAEKGVQVSATIPQEWFDTLEKHKWEAHKTRTQVIYTAIQEYLLERGLLEELTDDDGNVFYVPIETPAAASEPERGLTE